MKIDFHTHLDCLDQDKIAEFIGTREKLGTKACLSAIGSDRRKELPLNADTLKMAKDFPDAVIPFAYFDLREEADPSEVERLVERGFRGLKFITPYYEYDHDIYMPVYEAAEKLKIPALFHTGLYRPGENDPISRRPLMKNMHPLNLDRIARSFPELKIVMAHLGTHPYRLEAAELVKMHPNLYADLAGSGSWMALQADEMAKLFGQCNLSVEATFKNFRKLVLGSDAYIRYPHIMENAQASYRHTLSRTGVPEEIMTLIMGDTAAEWLKLKD